jgi:membrane-associated phospholipid phosphatase
MRDSINSSISLRLSRVLSNLLSPPIIALGAVFVIAFFSPIGTGFLLPWQSALLGSIFIVIGPIVPLSLMVARGKMTFDVKNRRDRPLLYLAAIIVYVCGALVAWALLNHVMAVLAIAYAAVTSAIAIVSLFWKVSAHAAGVAGPITGLIWIYGLLVLPFMILAGIVAWARWKLRLHTPLQLVGGVLIAIIVTATVYWILWGLPFSL